MRRAIYIALSVLSILLALVVVLFGVLQSGFARDRMRLWIAELTAGSSTEVHLDAIEGLVPFDMQLVGIRLSDRDGTWLSADRVSLAWSPHALLSGRLQVDQVAVGAIDLARKPAAEETKAPAPSGPLVPQLPIAIDLRQLSVERLALAAPILGEPAALAVKASAKLGNVGDDLSASLAVQQLSGHTGTAAIDLAYRPGQDVLKVTGNVEEPQGGVLGRLLGLPQGRDLQVRLGGEGPLESWRGRLNAKFDGNALLDLTADIRGRDERTISFALQAAPDAILPEQIRPLAAGGIDARGSFRVAPAATTIDVSEFSATSAAGRITASGVLGLSEPGDFALTLAVNDSHPFAALAPGVTWSGATLQARLQGTIDAPHLTADVALQNLAAAQMHVGTSKLALDASAEQGFEQPIGIRADLRMSTLASPDPRITALLANGIQLTFAGSADQAGTIAADKVDLRAGALQLSGSGRAEKWGATARKADAKLTIVDVAAITAPMGVPGKGAAEISLQLEPAATGDRLEVKGSGQAVSFGQPILDRLLGQSPNLHLALEGKVPQAMKVTAAQFTGAKLRLDGQGTVTDRKLDFSLTTNLEDAAAIDPTVQGAIVLDSTIYGTMDAPSVVAELNSSALTVAGHRAENVKLATTATDLMSKPKIELEGAASLDRLPAKVGASVAIDGERISAQNLALTVGKSSITGDVALAKTLASGKLALNAPDIKEIGRLAGVAMGGNLSGTLELNDAKGQQSVQLSATAHGISAADTLKIATLDATATADDLFGAPTIAADLKLDKPVIANHPLRQVSLTAKGPLSALRTKLSLAGPDLSAATEAEIAQIASGYRIRLQTLTADVKDIHVKNTAPATIEIGGKATRIEKVGLAIEDGMLRLDGSVAPDNMKLTTTMKSLPLSLARAFAPDLPITGRLDGDAQLSGTPAAPSGHFTIAGKDIGATDVPEQQADLQVAGTLQQGRLDIKGAVKPKSGGQLAFTAALPDLTSEARLQAQANGTFDLSLVDAFLAGGADRIKGKAELDLSAAGRLGAPQLKGTLRLVDSAYENLRYGIKLRRIAAEVRADGPVIRIASLSATTSGGGKISGQGKVDLGNGVETDLKIQARNATIIDTDLATATIDSDLAIAGNLQTRLKLGGKVKVLKADIRVPDKLPTSVQEIEVKEINAPPRVAARMAAQEPPPKQTAIVDLDLAVDAPQQLAVRGRGLDVELGGALQIRGTTDKPEIDGGFKLRRGSLDIAGKRLDFKEGQLTFEGGEQIDPILDLTAVTRAQDLQVTAKVEGSARAPHITLSSVPTMPEDEILAHLLFGKSAGALSPFELLQLAQATADLAGVNTGPGVLDKIRKSTGLDRLSLEQTEGAAGPSLSAGRYVAEGVYVGVSQGAKSASSAATVEIEVTPNVKLESEIGANAAGKAGVNLEWDY
ncbi:MAG TPA: translocation/assembly module TamB domain-containing protein [Dongiaceae bacterium]|jgi:translocation and assembly module TamB|nr:translocation/assembly module TamB domain-containing protein [Dongiaceae bacterium]